LVTIRVNASVGIANNVASNTLVVECKQGTASIEACKQVLRYRRQIKGLVSGDQMAPTMVVHGGSRLVPADVASFAEVNQVKLVYFKLAVSFSNSV